MQLDLSGPIDLSDLKVGEAFRGARMIAICRVLNLATDNHSFARALLWDSGLKKNVEYVLITHTGTEKITSVKLEKINDLLGKE